MIDDTCDLGIPDKNDVLLHYQIFPFFATHRLAKQTEQGSNRKFVIDLSVMYKGVTNDNSFYKKDTY